MRYSATHRSVSAMTSLDMLELTAQQEAVHNGVAVCRISLNTSGIYSMVALAAALAISLEVVGEVVEVNE